MGAVIIILLAFVITLIVAFTVTFTAVSLYINWRRRERPKYHYTEAADIYHVSHQSELTDTQRSSVDASNAHDEWTANKGKPVM